MLLPPRFTSPANSITIMPSTSGVFWPARPLDCSLHPSAVCIRRLLRSAGHENAAALRGHSSGAYQRARPDICLASSKMAGYRYKWGVAGLTTSAGIAGWVEFALLRRALTERIGNVSLDVTFTAKLWAVAIVAGAGWIPAETCLRVVPSHSAGVHRPSGLRTIYFAGTFFARDHGSGEFASTHHKPSYIACRIGQQTPVQCEQFEDLPVPAIFLSRTARETRGPRKSRYGCLACSPMPPVNTNISRPPRAAAIAAMAFFT